MSCSWVIIKKSKLTNFNDTMGDEVSTESKTKKNKYSKKFSKISTKRLNDVDDISSEIFKVIIDDSSENDATIAQLHQMQFDKEYAQHNGKLNKFSNEPVCFDNSSSSLNYDSEEDELNNLRDREDWDKYDFLEREFVSFLQCECKKQKGAKILPKHDVRRNIYKLLSFPLKFHTGDKNMFNLKSSKQVLNRLKVHLDNEQMRKNKILDINDRTIDVIAIDQLTRLILYKMINGQLLTKVNGVIAVGKEAVILHADLDPCYPKASEPLPKECVIKVFKANPSESKQLDRHVKDGRFKDNIGNQTTRKPVNLRAEKEMVNLMRLRRVGIPCPQVVSLKQHVLVMSFIGANYDAPAPKLKDADMKYYEYITAYEEIISGMVILYKKLNLILADLSEDNILWYRKQCYFVDVGQSVQTCDENASHILYKDCNNIINFFRSKDVQHIKRASKLFKSITGYKFEDKLALTKLEES